MLFHELRRELIVLLHQVIHDLEAHHAETNLQHVHGIWNSMLNIITLLFPSEARAYDKEEKVGPSLSAMIEDSQVSPEEEGEHDVIWKGRLFIFNQGSLRGAISDKT